MRREARCGTGLVLGLLILVGLPASAAGQEWFELYDDGVAALRAGDGAEAVALLQGASEARPEPGRLVPTYGTNFEPQYLPYLRLAEAHLLLDAVDDAADALAVSNRFGVSTEAERAPIEAGVEAARAARQPTPAPAPVTPPAPATVETGVTPEPAPVEPDTPPSRPASELDPPSAPSPSSQPATATPIPEPPAPSRATRVDEPAPAGDPQPTRPPAAQPAPPAVLDIVSTPPGAQVFVDDVPVGRTDPETGRLRLTTLSSGRHRVRISADGWQDAIREVDLAQRDLLVDARLVELPAPPPPTTLPVEAPSRTPGIGVTVAGLLAASLAVVLLVALVVRRRRTTTRPPRTPSTVSDPGTDEVFPRPFGDYSLLRRVGKGGMAAVYEAARDGESVALKRPLAGFVDDDRFRERFLHEAELGHTLHHPNIIRIFDHGRVGDTPYFTMELLRGETLAERLDREGRLELSEAMRITAQIAEALDYAHSKGVIHRDLKPSNIMVGPDGTVTVMDYGVARARYVDDVTTTRAFLGTPSYGAPETVQAASQPASDLYSLGVLLFEMLTGQLPFTGDTPLAVVKQHGTETPPAPSTLNHSLPEDVDALVAGLLRKQPAERPSAEGLRNQLSAYLAEGR